jgi:hypothetical protein
MEHKISVIKDNLKTAEKAGILSHTIIQGQIEELAQLFKGEKLTKEIVSNIFQMVFPTPLLSESYLSFCSLICDKKDTESSHKKTERTKAEAVSYLDNNYSKKTIELLNEHFVFLEESESDFNSVCESVYSGRSHYGIIPLLNSRDGLIISLYKLLQKYDLKIVASAKVLMDDGNTETEFVLICRNLSSIILSEDLRLILSITHNYDNTVAELLKATASQNIKLKSINTLPLEYTDDRCESVIMFDISACNLDGLCCFLQAAFPEANIVGIYSIVK